MATVPHSAPSRLTHLNAELYGADDDTLIAWQRGCAQAAEALRPQHDPERLTKALALAQGGHVEVEDDGFAVVTSGTKLYHVQADGRCDCPDAQHRGTPCKHVLAVLIHARAQELVAPSPSPAPAGAASSAPRAPAKAPRPTKPRSSAVWDVHEAPFSSCFKIRLGALEWPDDLEKLVYALRLARRNQRVVRQNLALSAVVIGLLVLGAIAGVFSLPVAVLGHEISEFVVIASGLRMLRT